MARPISKRIILPGETTPGLNIMVPKGYEDPDRMPEPIAVCTVPVGNGETCGQPFYEGEQRAWQKHVGDCARAHMDEIHAESPRTRLPAFDEANWNPDVAEHMKKVGARMLREGRLVTRPNERVHND